MFSILTHPADEFFYNYNCFGYPYCFLVIMDNRMTVNMVPALWYLTFRSLQEWVGRLLLHANSPYLFVRYKTCGVWSHSIRRLDIHGATYALLFLIQYQVWIFDQPDGSGRLLRSRSSHSAPPTKVRFYGSRGVDILSAGILQFSWPVERCTIDAGRQVNMVKRKIKSILSS